jgi:PKD repeat protein
MTTSVQGVTCTQNGTITVTGVCQVACSAEVPGTGTVGALVAFSATATPSYCQGTPSFAWTFGDGGTSVIQNPRHTYLTLGDFTWTMTTVADGITCTKTGTIVIGGNCSLACTGAATPSSGMAPLTVNFVGTATPTQCLGTPTYTWDFGDGQNSTTPAPTHTYTQPGTYAWTLVVTVDGIQCVQEGTITVTVNPNPPLLTVGNSSAAPGASVTVPVTLTGRDATLCGLTTDVTYDLASLTFTSAQIGPAALAAGKSLNSSTPSTGVIRLAILGINVTPIGDGIVAYLTFQVAQGASGSTVLNHSCGGTDCEGGGVGMSCPGGIVSFTSGIPGDCDNDGQVSIGEVQKAINMFLGLLPVGCGVDCNGDGAVSIGEVQKVVNVFLGLATGC